MASLHGARAHKLFDRGAIVPGYVADVALLDDLESFTRRAGAQGRARAGVPGGTAGRAARHDALRPRLVRDRGRAGAGAGDRHPAGPADHRRLGGGAAGGRRARRRRPGARPGEDRGDRAPPRHRSRRARARARVRAHRRRLRLDRRPRRAQPRRRGRVRRATWRCAPRGRRRSAAGWWSRSTGRCVGELPLPIAGLLSDRPLEEVAEGLEGLQDLLATMGVDDRGAVHDALVPGAVGDPVAEDHRSRARGRRRLRARAARAQRAHRALARSVRGPLRRALRALAVGRRGGVAARRSPGSTSSRTPCAKRCTPRRATPSSR